jgi:hypothetical protein
VLEDLAFAEGNAESLLIDNHLRRPRRDGIQALGISFGERKIFQHRDVTCELVLMETDLEGGKARFSIACKR